MLKQPAQIDVTQDATFSGYRGPVQERPVREKNSDEALKIIEANKLPLFHWTKDKPDPRDYIYRNTRTNIPARVDLRPWCTSVEDQDQLGSCTGQTVAGAIEYLNKKSGRATDVSRLFIYYYSRKLIGTVNYDSGAYLRDTIKVVAKQGAPLETLWPYNIFRFTTAPSNAAILDGQKRTVTLYERITTLNGCINALANGFPISVGFLVYSSFMSRSVQNTGMMPYPNVRKERLLGGHAVLLVGYDSRTSRFIARNSWGGNWGDRGYFYMPYQVISDRSMSDDFWVIRTVNNP